MYSIANNIFATKITHDLTFLLVSSSNTRSKHIYNDSNFAKSIK